MAQWEGMPTTITVALGDFLEVTPIRIAILLITPMMDIQLPFQIIFPYADVVAAVLATILYILAEDHSSWVRKMSLIQKLQA